VPFFYYVQHMKQKGSTSCRGDIADKRFATDPRGASESRRAQGDRRRADDQAVARSDLHGPPQARRQGVFVRSSTNAEDLPVNGAGLYERANVSARRRSATPQGVWASLWNLRAVDEREAFGIDQAPGVPAVMIEIASTRRRPASSSQEPVGPHERPQLHDQRQVRARHARRRGPEECPEQIIFDPTNDGTKILSRS